MKTLTICTLLLAFTPALICQDLQPQQIRADEVINTMSLRDAQREAMGGGYAGNRHYLLENEKFHKRAELVAAVHCDPDGSKHFEVVSESGWGSANKRVLKKMLESETETSSPAIRPQTRLTLNNYDARIVGTELVEGRLTYVIDVVPKRREKYLMEGRIWVDATDYALVRAEGKPARNPSFWTRSVHFVQQYEKKGAFWFPRSTESITQARIFGTTRVNITYLGYAPNVTGSASQEASHREIAYASH